MLRLELTESILTCLLPSIVFKHSLKLSSTTMQKCSPRVYIISIFYTAMSIHFLLCESCFWCASRSNNCNTYNIINECPSCKSNQIEFMPISHNEVYNFSYDLIRGVTLAPLRQRHIQVSKLGGKIITVHEILVLIVTGHIKIFFNFKNRQRRNSHCYILKALR